MNGHADYVNRKGASSCASEAGQGQREPLLHISLVHPNNHWLVMTVLLQLRTNNDAEWHPEMCSLVSNQRRVPCTASVKPGCQPAFFQALHLKWEPSTDVPGPVTTGGTGNTGDGGNVANLSLEESASCSSKVLRNALAAPGPC
jgi:hypothetical protein